MTVVLTCFRRPHLLLKQIDRLRAENAKIILWINGVSPPKEALAKVDLYYYASQNVGPWGSLLPLALEQSDYHCHLDDDTVPEPGWLTGAIELLEGNAIVGAACAGGTIFPKGGRSPRRYISCEPGPALRIDLPGYGWVVRRGTVGRALVLAAEYWAVWAEHYALAATVYDMGQQCWVPARGPKGCPAPGDGADDVALYKQDHQDRFKLGSHRWALKLGWQTMAHELTDES